MTATTPALPAGVRRVREPAVEAGGLSLHPVTGWDRYDWLVHGTTGAGPGGDLGLFGDAPAGTAHERWRRLQAALGTPAAVHSRQVHGAEVLHYQGATPGLLVTHGYDGHVTASPGTLLTVSVADCVPIFLLDPDARQVALLHGGWRGTAGGIVEAGLRALGASADRVVAHLGPAICGRCYEVGPEVHAALGRVAPDTSAPVDLRAAQARRMLDAGVPASNITVSEHCTLCGVGFYSHRGGRTERQMGVLAIR